MNNEIAVVIFSYDRPMQLEALLVSIQQHWNWQKKVYVIYRISGPKYADAYEALFNQYAFVVPIREQPCAFRRQLIDLVKKAKVRWISLMVDDDLLVADVDQDILPHLENGHNFSLRLGRHVVECQPVYGKPSVPKALKQFSAPNEHFIHWKWADGTYDWRMPFSLDGNIVNRLELQICLSLIKFENPNTLERELRNMEFLYDFDEGVAYSNSRLINIPMNRVQESGLHFPSMDVSTDDLLEKWRAGLRPDFSKIVNKQWPSTHVEAMPEFIQPSSTDC